MPVYAEVVLNPTEQDQKDLQLIYGEMPAISEVGHLVGARFNGRLVGALKLVAQGDSHQIVDINVREVTRRRGVARQVLLNLTRNLPEGVNALSVDLSANPELEPLFASLSFSFEGGLEAGLWQKA